MTSLEKDQLNLMNTIIDLSKKGTTGINKDVNTTTPTTPNNDTDVVEVRYKHKKKSRPLVIANNNTSTTSTLKAEKKILLFATRFDPDTTDEDIKKHIGTVCNSKLEKLSLKNKDRIASYKITIPLQDKDKILEENFWPNGIVLNRYYFPREQTNDLSQYKREKTNMTTFLGQRQKVQN